MPMSALRVAMPLFPFMGWLSACGGGSGESVDRLEQLADNISIPVVDSQSITTTESTAVAGVVTGHDPDGNPLRYYLSTPPTHGSVAGLPPGPVPGSEGSATGNFVYTPVAGYVGTDAFGFIGNDGDWNSSQGRVGVRVTAKGTQVVALAAKPGSAVSVPSPPAYLTVIHEMPGDGTRLYAVESAGVIPPIAVADTNGAGRITEAGWFEGQQAVYFRSNGALFLWRPFAQGRIAAVWPTSPGQSQLGEILMSADGGRLAFVSSDRGASRGSLYVLGADSVMPVQIVLDNAPGAGGWPERLRFLPGGTELAFDIFAEAGYRRCTARIADSGKEVRVSGTRLPGHAVCEAG